MRLLWVAWWWFGLGTFGDLIGWVKISQGFLEDLCDLETLIISHELHLNELSTHAKGASRSGKG